MYGPTFDKDVLLSATQAARILGITHQAVSYAIYRGKLPSVQVGKRRKVPLHAVITYGMKRGEPVETLMERAHKELQEREQVDWRQVAAAVLIAVGLGALLKYLTQSHQEATEPTTVSSKK